MFSERKATATQPEERLVDLLEIFKGCNFQFGILPDADLDDIAAKHGAERSEVVAWSKEIDQITARLERIEPYTVALLATNRQRLVFNSLPELTNEIAAILSYYEGSELRLPGLRVLPPHQAAFLATSSVHLLDLSGLTTLSTEQAGALSKSKSALLLDGILELTEESAAALGRTGGSLSLNGITELTERPARALVAGSNWINGTSRVLHLNGLTQLGADLARELGEWKGPLSLRGMHSICRTESCFLHKIPSLDLSGLRQITHHEALHFTRCVGRLDLSGLTSLDEESAQDLAASSAELILSGLTYITETQAQAFSRHHCRLVLTGVRSMTDSQLQALSYRRRKVMLHRDIQVSPQGMLWLVRMADLLT